MSNTSYMYGHAFSVRVAETFVKGLLDTLRTTRNSSLDIVLEIEDSPALPCAYVAFDSVGLYLELVNCSSVSDVTELTSNLKECAQNVCDAHSLKFDALHIHSDINTKLETELLYRLFSYIATSGIPYLKKHMSGRLRAIRQEMQKLPCAQYSFDVTYITTPETWASWLICGNMKDMRNSLQIVLDVQENLPTAMCDYSTVNALCSQEYITDGASQDSRTFVDYKRSRHARIALDYRHA